MQTRSAVVFGAGGSIGQSVARGLAETGFRLTLASRTTDGTALLARDLNAESVAIDASEADAVGDLLARVAQSGHLAAVVNCAGSVFLKPIHLTSTEEFDRVLRDNLWTSYAILRGATRALFKSGGSVVLCSSAAAAIGIANHGAISAAKAAVEGLLRSAAATYAARRIRVNAVAPGLVRSRATEGIIGNAASLQRSLSMHALGRLGTPEEVADLICWLADEERSGWVTGQIFRLDGGLSAVLSRG